MSDLVPRSAVPDLDILLDLAPAGRSATVWERYEAQLPQDGFGRLGLHCTLCLDGPCRISPFARGGPAEGAEHGICGFEAAAMNLALAARSVALGIMALAPFVDCAAPELLAVASGVAAVAAPAAGDAGQIASRIVVGARAAATALGSAATGQNRSGLTAAPIQTAAIGLGHLDPAVPSLLVGGAGAAPTGGELRRLLDYAGQQGVQVVVAAGSAAGLLPGGPPAVVDTACWDLLAGSGLVSAVLRLPPPPGVARRGAESSRGDGGRDGGRDGGSDGGRGGVFSATAPISEGVATQDPDEATQEAVKAARRNWDVRRGSKVPDGPKSGSTGATAVRLPLRSSPHGRTVLIAGGSRLRTPFGRGGLHQAVARISARMGWEIAAAGDAAFYLAPLASELLFSPVPVSAAPAFGIAHSSEVAVVFPEPVLASEFATAIILASAGVPVFVAAELPLLPAGLTALCAALGGLLVVGGGPTAGGGGEAGAGSPWSAGVVRGLAASAGGALSTQTLAGLEKWLAGLEGSSACRPGQGGAGQKGCGA